MANSRETVEQLRNRLFPKYTAQQVIDDFESYEKIEMPDKDLLLITDPTGKYLPDYYTGLYSEMCRRTPIFLKYSIPWRIRLFKTTSYVPLVDLEPTRQKSIYYKRYGSVGYDFVKIHAAKVEYTEIKSIVNTLTIPFDVESVLIAVKGMYSKIYPVNNPFKGH